LVSRLLVDSPNVREKSLLALSVASYIFLCFKGLVFIKLEFLPMWEFTGRRNGAIFLFQLFWLCDVYSETFLVSFS